MLDLDAEIESGRWPRVGGTTAGGYFEIEPGIVVAVPRPGGYRQSVAEAQASLAEFERLSAERGGAIALIILVDRVVAQEAEGRKVWSNARPGTWAGLALVCSSMLSRAIGSFFIRLRRPAYPLVMLDSIDSAIEWCRIRVGGV